MTQTIIKRLPESAILPLLSDDEIKSINGGSLGSLFVNVIAKLDVEFNVVSVTRDGKLASENFDDLGDNLIGEVVARDESTISIKAKVSACYMNSKEEVAGNLFTLPLEAKTPDDLKGTYAESFRLKFEYLRCPLGTQAGDKWTNGKGYALVDVNTQVVKDITIEAEGFFDFDNEVGAILDDKSNSETLAITCIMANGGVNFGKIIK